MEQNRRRSKKREAILHIIQNTDTHPSAEWIYDRLKPDYPDLSLGTVYRNLTLFRESGQIRSVSVVNGVERYDAKVFSHPHFVCRSCGGVYDVDAFSFDCTVSTLEHKGFHAESCDITYFGVCPHCTGSN